MTNTWFGENILRPFILFFAFAISAFAMSSRALGSAPAVIDTFGQCYLKALGSLEIGPSIPDTSYVLALISKLMYFDHDQVQAALVQKMGFTNVEFISANQVDLKRMKSRELQIIAADTEAVWAENENLIVLVFEGTSNLEDFLTDALAFKVPFKHSGQVHEGFLGAQSVVATKIQQKLAGVPNNKPLYLAGHSLGGALAVITAADILEREKHSSAKELLQTDGPWKGPFVAGVITIGMPRVGDQDFRDHFTALIKGSANLGSVAGAYSINYADNDDLISRLPDGFTPLNNSVLFDRSTFKIVPDLSQWSQDLLFRTELLRLRGDLQAHSTAYYLEYTFRLSHEGRPSGCLE